MTEFLTLVNVRNMYLDDRGLDSTDAVVQCHGGMGVGTGVQHDTVHAETGVLHLVDEQTFHIALEIVDFHVGIAFAQLWQVVFERRAAIDARFTFAQQIEVRTIDNENFHETFR